jgi:Asp-tRNA(Asn)/Glu-tRNA(Gln) amidotransferase C subunit
MSGTDRTPVSAARLGELLAAARLRLPEDRHEGLRQSLDGVEQLLGVLDEVDVGETPPAAVYDARWR